MFTIKTPKCQILCTPKLNQQNCVQICSKSRDLSVPRLQTLLFSAFFYSSIAGTTRCQKALCSFWILIKLQSCWWQTQLETSIVFLKEWMAGAGGQKKKKRKRQHQEFPNSCWKHKTFETGRRFYSKLDRSIFIRLKSPNPLWKWPHMWRIQMLRWQMLFIKGILSLLTFQALLYLAHPPRHMFKPKETDNIYRNEISHLSAVKTNSPKQQ